MSANVLKLLLSIKDQVVNLPVKPDTTLQQLLSNFRVLNDEQLYELSTYLEPREDKNLPLRPDVFDQFTQFGASTKKSSQDALSPVLGSVVCLSSYYLNLITPGKTSSSGTSNATQSQES